MGITPEQQQQMNSEQLANYYASYVHYASYYQQWQQMQSTNYDQYYQQYYPGYYPASGVTPQVSPPNVSSSYSAASESNPTEQTYSRAASAVADESAGLIRKCQLVR